MPNSLNFQRELGMVLLEPEFESEVDLQYQDPLVDALTIHLFLVVELDRFLRNSVLSILQFLGNMLLDFLDRVYSSFPIFHTNESSLFESDQPIDSIGSSS